MVQRSWLGLLDVIFDGLLKVLHENLNLLNLILDELDRSLVFPVDERTPLIRMEILKLSEFTAHRVKQPLEIGVTKHFTICLLYTSPSPRDRD